MSKFKQILMELGGTALNIPAGELKDLLEKSEDDIDVNEVSKKLKDKYRDNLNVFGKTQKDDGYKAAERSTAKKFEDSLKSRFSVTSDKQGDDLIDEINEALKKASKDKGKGDSMSDDDIKKSDVFIKMENLYKKQVQEAQEESKKKIGELETSYRKKENFSRFQKWADKKLDELGFVFDDDQIRAKNKKDDLIAKYQDYEFEFKNDDDPPIMSKDGKVLENEFGHKVDPVGHLDTIASKFYAKKVTDKRQTPNAAGGAGGGNGEQKYSGAMPKTAEDWDIMMGDPSISPADKIAITDYWEKSSK